jgi:hypothetical protein
METLSYIAVAWILISYAFLRKSTVMFDWANMLGNVPLVYMAWQKGALASAIISFTFGMIATYRLWERLMFR